MTREEAIRCLSVHSSTNGSGLCTDEQHYEAKQMAIEALEQQPCDDATLKDIFYMGCEYKEQEPKTGHWEWVQYDSNPNIGNWHCSECRTIIPHMPEETDNTPIYKWCPMCGAKMIEPKEESEVKNDI